MADLAKSKSYPIEIRSKKDSTKKITINGTSTVTDNGDVDFRDTSGNLIVRYRKDGVIQPIYGYQIKDIDGTTAVISQDQIDDINSFKQNTIQRKGRDALTQQINPATKQNWTEGDANAFINANIPLNQNPINTNPISASTVSVGNLKARDNYSSIKYPEIADPDQDYIQFTLLKYEPITLSTSITNTKRSNKNIGATITLPIQSGITDSNTVQWGEDRLNPIETAGALSAFNTIGANTPKNAGQEFIYGISEALKIFGGDPNTSNAIKAYFAGQAVGNQNLLSRINGAVLNPNLELLFQGPQLRNFNFNFQLTPRTDTETEKVRKIIRTFKQAMSVQRTASELFLSAPNIFKIRYIFAPSNDDHSYLPRFKDCALTNFSVDYTPDGNYMTYADGSMTSYRLTMQFQELQPIYNDDYTAFDKDTDDYIGY